MGHAMNPMWIWAKPTAATQRLTFELEQQCLPACCAAQHSALASGPGGLRFKSGTRPWLDALTQSHADTTLSAQYGGC